METLKNKTVKIVPKNHKYANTFGGIIQEFDFCTSRTYKNKSADKIISDWGFDKACRVNLKSRSRKKWEMEIIINEVRSKRRNNGNQIT